MKAPRSHQSLARALGPVRRVEAVRKISGYHDEPLHGNRAGQRSIRLSRQWRAIYAIQSDAQIEFIEVQEGNPHDY
jgi:toxin HigB-1